MKLIKTSISPIPFYDDIIFQNHRKDYAFGQIYPLITYKNNLLPFQIVIKTGTSISNVILHDFNTDECIDITDSIKENGLVIRKYDDFSLIKYPGLIPIIEIGREGRYYMSILIDELYTIVSDIFVITNNVDDYLLIEYGNHYDFKLKGGIIDFSENFKFKCYINTQIGKPEYVFEEEVTERMGYSFIESQVSKKIYKFTFIAPEYLCDALRIIRLCSNKRIISKLQQYDLISFAMNPEWEEQGDLASVECEFETDTVISNIGGYQPDMTHKSFNNDFNNDFI